MDQSWRNIPVSQLALQLAGRKDIDVPHVLRQVEGWQRLRHKVPSWTEVEGLEYPQRLALEQCSGEAAARFKAEMVERLLKDDDMQDGRSLSMADLTGGLGVDFSFLAPLFNEATYVERQEELCRLARHNFPLLGLQNTRIVCADAKDYLRQMQPVDLIFLDPARRDGVGRKTVRMEDCEPDVFHLLPLLLQKAHHIVLKLSPMLDIAAALEALGCVGQVGVVSAGGECKDLVLVLSANAASPVITVREGTENFVFTPQQEAEATPLYATECGIYLYEPGPALLKAGCFKLLATRFGLQKLHPHSHLYTGNIYHPHFPGRRFRVGKVFSFGKQDLKQLRSQIASANITVRNFPTTVDKLRAKLKLHDGGNHYLFATTLHNQSHVLILCETL